MRINRLDQRANEQTDSTIGDEPMVGTSDEALNALFSAACDQLRKHAKSLRDMVDEMNERSPDAGTQLLQERLETMDPTLANTVTTALALEQ